MPENPWKVLVHKDLNTAISDLTSEVLRIEASSDIPTVMKHPSYKLLKALKDIILKDVPELGPDHVRFRLGKTLKPQNNHWHRVKGMGLPQRYRLFFQYSIAKRAIVFAWVNDVTSLRKAGGKSDVYTVFEKRLKAGNPPNSFDELVKESMPLSASGDD